MFASRVILAVIVLLALGMFTIALLADKAVRLALVFRRERRFASEAQLAVSAEELADAALRHPLAPGARMVAALAVETLAPGHPRREQTLWAVSRREAARARERAHEGLTLSACMIGSFPLLGTLLSALAYMAEATALFGSHQSAGHGPASLPSGVLILAPITAGLFLSIPLFWAQQGLERAAERLAARLGVNVDEWVERLLALQAPPVVEQEDEERSRTHFPFEIRTRRRSPHSSDDRRWR